MATYHEQALAYLHGEMGTKEIKAFERALTESQEARDELARTRELLDRLEATNEEQIAKMASDLIKQAIDAEASDIHILPGFPLTIKDGQVVYRVDGHLRDVAALPGKLYMAVIDRLKVMCECNVAERQLPQDGRIVMRYQEREYDLRVNFLPTINGERVTARILDRSRVLLGLDKLGLAPGPMEAIGRMLERPYGLILVAGFTDSGRTTLLYSMLKRLTDAPRRRNILMVEDPVEYRMEGISQVQVNKKAGLTYANALRVLFHCDPDVVMVSEMRNLEVANSLAEMALTGQLALSQLHVPSALGAIGRLEEMGVEPHIIANTLAGVVGQRLVRKVCTECAVEYTPAPEALLKAGLTPEDGPFRHGVGCPACGQTGFKGRIGLFEVLEVEEALRPLISAEAPVETLWQATFGRNGGSLWDDARDKIRKGLTTVEEAAWALFDYPHS